MKIGVIVATESEQEQFLGVFGKPNFQYLGTNEINVLMWRIQRCKEIYLLCCGPGEIAAAISTQYLIDKFQVERIINCGVAGGLSEEHFSKRIGLIKKIIHYDFDLSAIDGTAIGEYPGEHSQFLSPRQDAIPDSLTSELDRFICASADKFVTSGEPKMRLRREFGADICEMEAAGVVIACNKNYIPCTLIKIVTDGVDEDAEAYDGNIDSASRECTKLIAKYINQI